MKLKQNTYPYEYSIREDEIIDYIFLYDTKNTKSKVEEYLKNLINNNELTIGDGCEGTITIKKHKIIVENHWITSTGLHWLIGDLNQEILEYPNE